MYKKNPQKTKKQLSQTLAEVKCYFVPKVQKIFFFPAHKCCFNSSKPNMVKSIQTTLQHQLSGVEEDERMAPVLIMVPPH